MSLYNLPQWQQDIVRKRMAADLADNDHYQELKTRRDELEDKIDDIASDAIAEAIKLGFADEETENMTKGNNRVGGEPC